MTKDRSVVGQSTDLSCVPAVAKLDSDDYIAAAEAPADHISDIICLVVHIGIVICPAGCHQIFRAIRAEDSLTVNIGIVHAHCGDVQIGSFYPLVLQLLLRPKERCAFISAALLGNDPACFGKVGVCDKCCRGRCHFPALTRLYCDIPYILLLFLETEVALPDQPAFAALYHTARPDKRPALAAFIDVNAVGVLHRAAMYGIQPPSENKLAVTLNAGRVCLIVQC